MPLEEVQIVMPVYRALTMTKTAIQTCLSLTEWPFHLWVADDCSQDAELNRYLGTLPGGKVTVVHSERRRGFGDLCNWIANQHAKTGPLCFLNSDTEALPMWLTHMMTPMVGDERVGIVGAKLLYPAGRAERAYKIQHCGVARDKAGLPYHIWRDKDYAYAPSLVDRYVNAVTGACMVVRRECWTQLHGFDRAYEFGQFEDIDFAWRARKADWKVFLAAQAILFHYEHGTGESYVYQTHDQNRATLLKRWAGIGSDEAIFATEEVHADNISVQPAGKPRKPRFPRF